MPSISRPHWYKLPVLFPADGETVWCRRSLWHYQPFLAVYTSATMTFLPDNVTIPMFWTELVSWSHIRVLRVQLAGTAARWILDTYPVITGVPTGLQVGGVDATSVVSLAAGALTLAYALPVVGGATWSTTVNAGTTPSVEQSATGIVT